MKKKHYVTLIKWALFVIYMILLFYVVFFAEGMGRAEIASGYKYNLTLFTEIRRYWRYLGHFDSLGWIAFLKIIGNVLAFIPFGIFVPWLSNGRINVFATFSYGFAQGHQHQSSTSPKVTTSCTLKFPFVIVPVLSITTEVISFNVSKYFWSYQDQS